MRKRQKRGVSGRHWLVDGYNVTRCAEAFAPAAAAGLRAEREALLELLSGFAAARVSAKVTVVFDGPANVSAPVAAPGVRVRFSGGRSADELIKQIAESEPDPGRVVVVSADRSVTGYARGCGCRTSTPDDFLKEAAPRDPAAGGPGRSGHAFSAEERRRLERDLGRALGIGRRRDSGNERRE